MQLAKVKNRIMGIANRATLSFLLEKVLGIPKLPSGRNQFILAKLSFLIAHHCLAVNSYSPSGVLFVKFCRQKTS
jgi:primosomal replication protein N